VTILIREAIGSERFLQIMAGGFFSAAGSFGLWSLSRLNFVRSTVRNISEIGPLAAPDLAGFIRQDPACPQIEYFRSLARLDSGHKVDLAAAIRVCRWVHEQQKRGESWKPHLATTAERVRGDIDDPIDLLLAMRNGTWATCRNFSFLMVAAIQLVGMRGRVVIASPTHWKTIDGHVMTEVWIPNMGKWVLMDPMWNVHYRIGGIPASASEVYKAVQQGKQARIERVGPPNAWQPADSRLMFTHLYIAMTDAFFDGYGVRFFGRKRVRFTHFANTRYSRFPTAEKRVALIVSFANLLLGLMVLLRS
jgi:hypothetical protein